MLGPRTVNTPGADGAVLVHARMGFSCRLALLRYRTRNIFPYKHLQVVIYIRMQLLNVLV
jgi:hypothetical protein